MGRCAIHLMNTVFNREAAHSYLFGNNYQRTKKSTNNKQIKPSDMINPSYPANIGSYAGEVIKSGKGYVTIRADADIGVRDLLQVFENSSEEPALLHVKNIKIDGKRVFGIKAGDIAIVDTERQYRQGARLYLLSSQKVKEMFASKVPKKLATSKIPVDLEIKIRPESVEIKGFTKHFSFSRDFSVKLEKGIHRTTETENIKECFTRLGNTPFELASIHTEISGELFVPLSVLNEIRREYFQIFCEEWRKDRERRCENIKKWIQEKFIEYSSSNSQLPGESSILTSINPPLKKGVQVYPHRNFPTSPFLPLSEGDRGTKLRDNEYSPPLVGGARACPVPDTGGGGELLQNNKLLRSIHGNIRINIQRTDSLLKYEIDLLKSYFKGKQVDFDFPLDLGGGTPFQILVWNKLREIPYGECRSYGWVAEQIGDPHSARAVGMANNKNPLAPVIPCHRVIGSNGSLTGYASGLHIKKYLLEMEKRISNGDSPQNTRNKRK